MTEGMHPYEALMYEGLAGGLSLKVVTAVANAANPTLAPGCVMGKITASGLWTVHDNGVVNGAQTLAYNAAGILMGATGPGGPNVTSLTGEPAVVLFQHGVVNGHMLSFADGMDATEQATALASLRDTADIDIDARF
jgi:hypothetical protein